MQPPQPAHGIGVASIPGAELDIPLPQKPAARPHGESCDQGDAPIAKTGRPVSAKVTVPMTAAMPVIKKCALNMPRSNCVTGGMSSFTSRKAGEARKK